MTLKRINLRQKGLLVYNITKLTLGKHADRTMAMIAAATGANTGMSSEMANGAT